MPQPIAEAQTPQGSPPEPATFPCDIACVRGQLRRWLTGDLEDAVQETLLRALASRDRVRSGANLRAFLRGVGRNVVREHYRWRRRSVPQAAFEEIAIPSVPCDDALHRARTETLLASCMTRLPDALRESLELYYWERMSATAIGTHLGIPANTVRSRLHRARDQLRVLLAVEESRGE